MNRETPNPEDPGKVGQFMSGVGILAAMVGQVITYAETAHQVRPFPTSVWISVAGVAVFMLGFVVRPGKRLQALSRWLPSGKSALILAAGSLAALATFSTIMFETNGRSNFLPALTFWLGAALCYVVAFLPRGQSGDWRAWLKEHRQELLVLAAITLLAGLLRFHELGSSPRIIDGDEGKVGLAALSTSNGRLANPFALWENFGALYLQAISMSMSGLGVSPFGLRFLPAVGGTLAVPALYLFARQVAGRNVAVIAALLAAFLHTHLHFSRIASVAYIQGTWLGPLELYLLLSGLQKRSSWRAAAGGVLLAIHFSVYLTAQVLAVMVLVYFFTCLLLLGRWFRPALPQAAAFLGGFAGMIAPMAYMVYRYPGEFMNRLQANGTFQSGWLATRMAETGQGAAQVLVGRVVHAFLSLIYFPSIDFYGSPVPTLPLILAVLFLLGLAIALLRLRDSGVLLLNGYFWSVTLAVGMFAEPESADTYRMLMAVPPALVMAGMGLDAALERLGLGASKRMYTLTAATVLAALFAFNTWTYYADFAGRCRFGGNLSDRFASYLGNYVRGIDNQFGVYLLSNDTYRYGTHPSVDFLSQRRPITNIPDPLETLQAVSGETILANPDRVAELEAWAHDHPGGELDYVRDCTTTIMLAYRYP